MRPPKRIAILCRDEDELRLLRFIVSSRGRYTVFGTSSLDELVVFLRSSEPHVLMIDGPDAFVSYVVRPVQDINTVIFGDVPEGANFVADQIAAAGPDYYERVLEAVRLAAKRKRGPKKGRKGNHGTKMFRGTVSRAA